MGTIATVVVIIAAAWIGFSAFSLLTRKAFVVDNLADCGVPERWWPWLGAAKALGAVGLLVGLAVPAVGVAAAAGLIVYFAGAVVTIVKARAYGHVPFPAPVPGARTGRRRADRRSVSEGGALPQLVGQVPAATAAVCRPDARRATGRGVALHAGPGQTGDLSGPPPGRSTMPIVLDADVLPPADRAEAIRTLIWDSVVRVEIEHQPDPAAIRAQGRITDAGHLNICSIRSNATTVTRTPRLAHDPDDPYLFLGLQVTGESMVVQHGREAVLRPGDLAVYDTRQPYTLVNEHGIHQHFFRVPIADLELSARAVDAVTAVRLDGARPLARVAGRHLRELAENVGRLTEQEIGHLAEPSLALIRALVAAQLDDLPEAREHVERTLEHRIVHYLRAHVHEPDLSAAKVAHEHHVSVRHLYRLLAGSGIVLGDWVRQQRLDACRRTLAEPGDTRTIAAVAHQWGFVDVTYFGRAFKAAYGMTPREWRTTSRARHLDLRTADDVAQEAEDGSRWAETPTHESS